MGLRRHSLKRGGWVEKPAHHSLVLSFHFWTNFMTSFHPQMGCWQLNYMFHMEIPKVPWCRNFLHVILLIYWHRRKFPETNHLNLCEAGGVRIWRVELQTAKLNPEFLRIEYMFSRSKCHWLLVASHSRVGFFFTIHIQQEFRVVLDFSQPENWQEQKCLVATMPLSYSFFHWPWQEKTAKKCSTSSTNMPWPLALLWLSVLSLYHVGPGIQT